MDSATFLYIAGFFFILGAALVAVCWLMMSLIHRTSAKNKAASATDPNLAEVAHLMRDVRTQDLVVEMDGKAFKVASELSPGQHRRLSFSSNVLSKWLQQTNPEASPAPEDKPASESPDSPVTESDWIPAETAPMEPQNSIVPPFVAEPMPEVKPVSTQLPDVVGGILKPTPTPAPAFKSIALQINDILQARITGTPFEARHIMVSDGPEHGVEVSLDGEKYQGVKDVPDESVRNLIRSAVMEWEKQSKPSSR